MSAVYAGNGFDGSTGDGGAATSAAISNIDLGGYVAVDTSGNVYFSDKYKVRKVSTAGLITTVAGTGTSGFSGDGGAATSASLCRPLNVAVDSSGNLYIADKGNHRIRLIKP